MTETNDGSTRYVLGVDPGGTTGLAVVAYRNGKTKLARATQLPWEEAWREVDSLVARLAGLLRGDVAEAAVACEKFTINAQTAQRGQKPAEDSLGMVGVVRRACLNSRVEMAPTEQASAAKRLVSDAVLRQLGLHTPGSRHANDAARHAVLLGVKRRWIHGAALYVEGS